MSAGQHPGLAKVGFKRFRQAVRRDIRVHVKRERQAPGLSMWVAEERSPWRVGVSRVGAAEDRGDVKARILAGIDDASAAFAAVGRLAHAVPEGEVEAVEVCVFTLVVCSSATVEQWEVDVDEEAGSVGGWRDGEFAVEDFFFVQQALRRAR